MQLPRTPSFRLDGRRALVTGASRGIGLACAAALAEAGAAVTLAARSREALEAAAEAFRARGWTADVLVLDVDDPETTGPAIEAAGPFDVLVNNAGVNRPAPMAETTREQFDTVMDVNVRGAYFVAQAVVRGLIAADKPGSIVNMSSQLGHVGGARRTIYCASKFAVEGMSKAMAVELGPRGIRVNTVCPTFIETDLTRASLADPDFRALVLSEIKLGRIGVVEDLMGPVVFLASDASALVTGASLLVDGGWTAG